MPEEDNKLTIVMKNNDSSNNKIPLSLQEYQFLTKDFELPDTLGKNESRTPMQAQSMLQGFLSMTREEVEQKFPKKTIQVEIWLKALDLMRECKNAASFGSLYKTLISGHAYGNNSHDINIYNQADKSKDFTFILNAVDPNNEKDSKKRAVGGGGNNIIIDEEDN